MNPAILLVDVPSVAREELKTFLQNHNFDVVASADVESTFAYCRQIQPELVLLYDTLPGISSFTLCRQFKSDPINELTQVVLVKPSSALINPSPSSSDENSPRAISRAISIPRSTKVTTLRAFSSFTFCPLSNWVTTV